MPHDYTVRSTVCNSAWRWFSLWLVLIPYAKQINLNLFLSWDEPQMKRWNPSCLFLPSWFHFPYTSIKLQHCLPCWVFIIFIIFVMGTLPLPLIRCQPPSSPPPFELATTLSSAKCFLQKGAPIKAISLPLSQQVPVLFVWCSFSARKLLEQPPINIWQMDDLFLGYPFFQTHLLFNSLKKIIKKKKSKWSFIIP